MRLQKSAEAIVGERSNLKLAYQQVVENKGAPGVDDVSVAEFKDWLKIHWPSGSASRYTARVACG
jgi:RNA-directed DNA polymerase